MCVRACTRVFLDLLFFVFFWIHLYSGVHNRVTDWSQREPLHIRVFPDLRGFVCPILPVVCTPNLYYLPILPLSLLCSPFLHHSCYVFLIPLPTPIDQKLIPYGRVQAFEFTPGLSLAVTGYLSPTVLHSYLC
ncbi:hypothetical protein EDB87DRAFT_1638284 [Lactarius vividus]|nr:hypothetical protein EDB87DRAFT_1638284 [Lactarius vividus]